MAAVVVSTAAACQREHVNLDRPCVSDTDCVGGAVCNNGQCFGLPDPTTTPTGGAWPVRIPITLNGNLIADDVGDVAVPLRLPSALFATGGAPTTTDGRDVRITDLDDHPLAHQLESWDAQHGYLVWVRVPQLKKGESRKLLLYVGNPKAVQQSTSGIWDADYVGVWHLADSGTTDPLRDATSAGRDGDRSEDGVSPGVFASGQHYDGNQRAFAPEVTLAAGSAFTIEGWFAPEHDAHPYRRVLTGTLPSADMEALWNAPGSQAFLDHTGGDYTALRVTLGEDRSTYAVLETDHGVEIWIRGGAAGPVAYTLAYGLDGIADASDPPNTFHYWAEGSRWNMLFTPEPTASTSGSLALASGRMGTTLPFDMRDGYLVQTYANYVQQVSETRRSGGLPHITSSMRPLANLTTPTSGVFVRRAPGIAGGLLRTSVGTDAGFDQASELDVPFLTNDIAIGIHADTAYVYVTQVFARQQACAWSQPLDHLLLGNYDGSATMYYTNYIAMFVRRWHGSTPVLSSTRERAGGIGIGDFAVGVQTDAVYVSTNTETDLVALSSGPLAAHHVALVVDGEDARLYIDGAEELALSSDAHGVLAGFSLADVLSVNGVIDEVRVSKVARPEALLAFQVASARGDFISVGAPETVE